MYLRFGWHLRFGWNIFSAQSGWCLRTVHWNWSVCSKRAWYSIFLPYEQVANSTSWHREWEPGYCMNIWWHKTWHLSVQLRPICFSYIKSTFPPSMQLCLKMSQGTSTDSMKWIWPASTTVSWATSADTSRRSVNFQVSMMSNLDSHWLIMHPTMTILMELTGLRIPGVQSNPSAYATIIRKVINQSQELGVVLWSLDSSRVQQRVVEKPYQLVLCKVHGSCVILLH